VGLKHLLIQIDGTADAAFALEVDGRISSWNAAAAELFGLNKEEAMKLYCHQIFQCSDDNQIFSSEECILTRVARDNEPIANFDLRLQTKTGKQWCNLSRLIAIEPASGTRHTVYIVRPCEVHKRFEQALSEFVRTQSRKSSNGAAIVSPATTTAINAGLTSREVEVLRSLAKGHSTRTIANQLNISSATVNNHIKHILTKFDVHTRLQAIRHAESVGVI
jgi:PAS domain S-box-containing protein